MLPTVTTTITPAATIDLTDIQTVKRELDIADNSSDDLLSRWISSTSSAVQQYCNRIFAVQTLLDKIYRDCGAGLHIVSPRERPLQLSGFPIASSPTVIEDSVTLVENIDFLVNYDAGQLFRLDSNLSLRRWASLPVTVQYQAGYATIPADVVDAAVLMVKHRWFTRKRDPYLRQESIPGVIEQQWWIAQGPGSNGSMPPDVEDMLEKYRVPVVG